MTDRKKPLIDSDEYYGIRILKDGTWLYGGTPITRHNLVKLFASVLEKDEKGDFWLSTPYERGRIEVEDAPFTAVELKVESSGKGQDLLFRTNLDDWIKAGPENPVRVHHDPKTGEPAPYILVRKNLEALILRPVYYDLVRIATEEKGEYSVESGGACFSIGRINE